MTMLKHPLLMALAKQVDTKLSPLRWIDLYAAQYMAELYHSPGCTSTAKAKKHVAGKTYDLFDTEMADTPESVLTQSDMLVLALMCSYVVSQGQTYLSLEALPQEILGSAKACGYRPGYRNSEHLQEALRHLEQPGLFRIAGLDEPQSKRSGAVYMPLETTSTLTDAPLILWQGKLYLAKYWMLHQRFEAWLQSRRDYIKPIQPDLLQPLANMLAVLFNFDQSATETNAEPDWQAVAAAHTLINPFSLITGGPGTGKTTTAASLLCLLMYRHQLDDSEGKLNIRLLAPTGKAAVRLADAIRNQLEHIESRLLAQGLKLGKLSESLPATGETVHRFLYELGGLRDAIATPKAFRTDQLLANRSQQQTSGLPVDSKQGLDVIIVDESSMMDLALMVELVTLMPPQTRLILLGDHYQLPAVDPGQVFADCVARFARQQVSHEELSVLAQLTGFSIPALAAAEPVETGIAPRLEQTSMLVAMPELGFQPLCALRKTYRFDGDLKQAADYIKRGDLRSFTEQFWPQSTSFDTSARVVWHALSQDQQPEYSAMVQAYAPYFTAVARKATLAELAKLFEGYQLLCSTLEGPLGVDALNRYIEQRFHGESHASGRSIAMRSGGELYHGKAILVSRNHPHLGIFNGDIGFVIEDENDGNLNVHFPASNQSVLIVAPARISEWQTAYAMTVHKSQGSEYQHVGVVLAGYAKDLLTRSLLYTALTRSKQHCDIWAGNDSLKRAFEVGIE